MGRCRPAGARALRAGHPLRLAQRRGPARTAYARVRPAPRSDDRSLALRPGGTLVNGTALEAAVWGVLGSVEDPELPIGIIDLGLVREVRVVDGRVSVRLVPTWTGCPALDVIRTRVREALLALPDVREATVEYTYEEPWTLDRMSARGREQLAVYGLAVPRRRFSEPPVCPYCGSHDVAVDSLFGPTLCRATYLCRSCRNPFERFKPPADPEPSTPPSR
ncbi:MAG: phenylacetate-CoA oxygenase subunit PaaJ [Bacillati bacterium ANGP1]|uniref:Phenylacetate-CoA oxygenase subunit PaaJ n=1 Tax=Candidatus Segetimicrobium genomatis TaxID=2569760 RepID=A0A537KD92_9BACT|nr:MAG: phenylacetate-CoA oxygenase subunit PaaJ [Terrabacteria group bacterium ANGP1]